MPSGEAPGAYSRLIRVITRATGQHPLPAGIHVFELEARASKHGQQVSLPKAQYQFVLESSYVGPAMTKGEPAVKTQHSQVEAYTRQRALLIGVPAYDGYFLFTRYLVEGLSGSADIVQDGVITLSELMVWVRWQVARASGGTQTPSFARVKGTGEMMFDLGGTR